LKGSGHGLFQSAIPASEGERQDIYAGITCNFSEKRAGYFWGTGVAADNILGGEKEIKSIKNIYR
jgi:hypothetical protein